MKTKNSLILTLSETKGFFSLHDFKTRKRGCYQCIQFHHGNITASSKFEIHEVALAWNDVTRVTAWFPVSHSHPSLETRWLIPQAFQTSVATGTNDLQLLFCCYDCLCCIINCDRSQFKRFARIRIGRNSASVPYLSYNRNNNNGSCSCSFEIRRHMISSDCSCYGNI